MEYVASSPGDIVIIFMSRNGSESGTGGTPIEVPLKTVSARKNGPEVNPEFVIGSHQAQAMVQGKIMYEGDFTVGTWIVDNLENPNTWNALIKTHLSFQGDEGLSREFEIQVNDRAETHAGEDYERSGQTGPYSVTGDSLIEKYERCLLTGDSTDIPEVGGTVTKKYSFRFFRRDPL
jgi:hypothetical protein